MGLVKFGVAAPLRKIFWPVILAAMNTNDVTERLQDFQQKARETARKNTCINNLRLIDGAIQQWALENGKNSTDDVVKASLTQYLGRGGTGVINGTDPGGVKCPSSGTYSVGKVNAKPTCNATVGTHVLP